MLQLTRFGKALKRRREDDENGLLVLVLLGLILANVALGMYAIDGRNIAWMIAIGVTGLVAGLVVIAALIKSRWE